MKTSQDLSVVRKQIQDSDKPLLLWLPVNTRNRTAFLSKNIDRDEDWSGQDEYGVWSQKPFKTFINENGELTSYNPNCLTDYKIIEVPAWVDKMTICAIAGRIADKNTHPHNIIRAISAGNADQILNQFK